MIFEHSRNKVDEIKVAEEILRNFSINFYSSYSSFHGFTQMRGNSWEVMSSDNYKVWTMFRKYIDGYVEKYTYYYDTKNIVFESGTSMTSQDKEVMVTHRHSTHSGFPARYTYSPITEYVSNELYAYFDIRDTSEAWNELGLSNVIEEGDISIIDMKYPNLIKRYPTGEHYASS